MRGGVTDQRSPLPIGEALDGDRLPILDGLRAVAVLIVIVGHESYALPADLGVSIFFVLSGFLITWLLIREWEKSGGISLRKFYIRRTLRIFPAYYVFLALTVGADFALGDMQFREFGPWAATYTLNYFNALHGHPVNSVSHAWSLAIEEQFYLLWPVTFIVLARSGRSTRAWGLAAIIGGVMAWRCVAWYTLGYSTAWVYNAFDTRFDNLAVGCLLAVTLRLSAVRSSALALARHWWLPVCTVLLLFVSRAVLPTDAWHYGPGFTVDAILIALLIVQLIQLSRHAAWRWLDHPWMRFVGAISYPMYLYHAWGIVAGRRLGGTHQAGQLIISIVITGFLGYLSYRLVEGPFLRLKERFTTGSRSSIPREVGQSA